MKENPSQNLTNKDDDKPDFFMVSKMTDFLNLIKKEEITIAKAPNNYLTLYKRPIKTPESIKLQRARRSQDVGIPPPNLVSQLVYIKDIEAVLKKKPVFKSMSRPASQPNPGRTNRVKQAKTTSLGTGLDMSIFRENIKKYRPIVLQPLMKEEKIPTDNIIESKFQTASAQNNNFQTFLTNLNVQDNEKNDYQPQKLSYLSDPNNTSISQDYDDLNKTKPEDIQPLNYSDICNQESAKQVIQKVIAKEFFRNRPPVKRIITSSQENYEKAKKARSKLFISFKNNLVQEKGISDPIEHLIKVFNGEGTKFLPHKLPNTFGNKKETRKMAFDAYLANHDPKALKYSNPLIFHEYYYDDETYGSIPLHDTPHATKLSYH